MPETATEVLLPKTKTITICGKKVCLKPLTLRQLLGSFAVLKAAKADIAMPEGATDQAIMLKMLSNAGESLPELAAVLTGESAEDLQDLSLEDASELALAVSEINDFGKIFSNFQKAMALSNPKK